jgi:arginyl-tRNA synthetase
MVCVKLPPLAETMPLKSIIESLLHRAVDALPASILPPNERAIDIEVRRTRALERGDFASNVAMRLATARRRDPLKLAEALAGAIPADPAIRKVEIAGSGFINFFLTDAAYHHEIARLLAEPKARPQPGPPWIVRSVLEAPAGPLNTDHPLYRIQYAHARVSSLRRQLADRALAHDAARGVASLNRLVEPEESILIRRLSAFAETLEHCARNRAPEDLVRYLADLAGAFHAYQREHALIVDDAAVRDARIALAFAAGTVLRRGLELLGAGAPSSM